MVDESLLLPRQPAPRCGPILKTKGHESLNVWQKKTFTFSRLAAVFHAGRRDLQMIINTIRADACQVLVSGDIIAFPHRSEIQLDDLHMAAFFCPFQDGTRKHKLGPVAGQALIVAHSQQIIQRDRAQIRNDKFASWTRKNGQRHRPGPRSGSSLKKWNLGRCRLRRNKPSRSFTAR